MNREILLSLLKEKNYHQFKELVESKDVNFDYFYADPDNGTLLDIACRSEGNSRFIQLLIQYGADINLANSVTGKNPIHEAIEFSDAETLTVLSECSNIQVNIPDTRGNTPLHVAVKRNDIELVRILFQNQGEPIDVNVSTGQNPTALHLALLQGNVEIAQILLKRLDIDLDYQKDTRGRTCRQIIHQKYPELLQTLPTRSICDPKKILHSLLTRGETELFTKLASEVSSEFLSDSYADETYLWLACDRGYANVVDVLLERKVDPNKVTVDSNAWYSTPIMRAARKGYYDIVVKLLKEPDIQLQNDGIGSVLHSVIKGMFCKPQGERVDHQKCLELLLNDPAAKSKLDVDFEDYLKYTALHYAILYNDKWSIKSLIHAGAHLYRKNWDGEVLLTLIKPSTLEDYLDDCISSKYQSNMANDYLITFDYRIFAQPNKDRSTTDVEGHETEFFSIIERIPELRKLLKHPVMQSFLYMKWYLVRKFHLLHLIFYLILCLSLSVYIYQIHHPSPNVAKNSSSTEPESVGNSSSVFLLHNTTTTTTTTTTSHYQIYLGKLTLLLYTILILQELCKFCVSTWSYLRLLENWFDIALITMVGALFVYQQNSNEPSLAVGIILVSWMKLLFLFGKYPSFSTYIELFKTVTLNFSKFLALYSIMMISFAYSFYILYKDALPNRFNDDDSSPNSTNDWKDPITSLFLSVTMISGQFDVESMPLKPPFGSCHVLFILFFFLVTIVMYNLLNGLAVSDTQAIIEDAELVALVSRVKLISQLELLAICNPFSFLRCICPSRFVYATTTLRQIEKRCLAFYNRMYRDKITLFTKISPKTSIEVLPYFKKAILLPNTFKKHNFTGMPVYLFNKGYPWKMPSSILKQAIKILEMRNEFEGIDDSTSMSIKKVSSRYQSTYRTEANFNARIRDLEFRIDEKNTKRDEKLMQDISNLISTHFESKVNQQIEILQTTINEKIEKLEVKINQQIETLQSQIDQKFDTLQAEIDRRIGRLKEPDEMLR